MKIESQLIYTKFFYMLYWTKTTRTNKERGEKIHINSYDEVDFVFWAVQIMIGIFVKLFSVQYIIEQQAPFKLHINTIISFLL